MRCSSRAGRWTGGRVRYWSPPHNVAALLLGIERAQGGAPLIGSSAAIRQVRDRIERLAATDFTVLIEGAIGPQPHPSFIEVFGEAAVGGGERAVAGAGED